MFSHSARIHGRMHSEKTTRRLLSRRNYFRLVTLQTCRPNVVRRKLPSSSVRAPEFCRSERPSTSWCQPSSALSATRSIITSRCGKSSTLQPSSTSIALHLSKRDRAAQRLHPYRRHVRDEERPNLRRQTIHRKRRLHRFRPLVRGVEVRQSRRRLTIHSPRLHRHHRARGRRAHLREAGKRRRSCTVTSRQTTS